MKIKSNPYSLLLSGFGIFLFLSAVHYFSFRPLWLDETFVLNNLTESSYRGLLGPLEQQQTFPRATLLLIQMISHPVGHAVWALRLVSLAAMVAAAWLWMRFVFFESGRGGEALCAAAFFATSTRMVYYAAELKPYAVDVLVSGGMMVFLMRQAAWARRAPTRIEKGMFFAAPFSILFSYGALFWVGLPFWNLLMMMRGRPYLRSTLAAGLLALAMAASIVYQIDLRWIFQQKAMVGYWKSYFLCTESVVCFADTFGEGLKRLVVYWGGDTRMLVRAAVIFVPLFVVSLFRDGIREWRQFQGRIHGPLAAALVIFAELFVLGWRHRYPFTGERITLFYAPLVFLAVARGIGTLKNRWPAAGRLIEGYAFLYITVCGFRTAWVMFQYWG